MSEAELKAQQADQEGEEGLEEGGDGGFIDGSRLDVQRQPVVAGQLLPCTASSSWLWP